MINKLKPCPFCGGRASMRQRTLRTYGTTEDGQKRVRIAVQAMCGKCKARGPVFAQKVILPNAERFVDWMKDQAAGWWNERRKD